MGTPKIEQALQQKHIPSSVSAPLFAEIEDETYMEVLLPMLRSKWKTIKGRNEYERSMKLIRYAMGRGYDITVIRKCVDLIAGADTDRKSTRLNSSHANISYAVFCLKKKKLAPKNINCLHK